MKTLMVFLLMMCLQFLTAGTYSSAAVYSWKDSRGVTHFTDTPESIPPEFLEKAVNRDLKESYSEVSDSEPPVHPQVRYPVITSSERPGGMSRGGWQNRYASLRREISGLKAGISAKKEKMTEYRRKWITSRKRGERQNMNTMEGEIARDEERIRDLEKQLEALDLEAARNAVPLDWRK